MGVQVLTNSAEFKSRTRERIHARMVLGLVEGLLAVLLGQRVRHRSDKRHSGVFLSFSMSPSLSLSLILSLSLFPRTCSSADK